MLQKLNIEITLFETVFPNSIHGKVEWTKGTLTGPWIFPPFLFLNAATETKKLKTTRGPNFVFGFFVMVFIGIPNQNSKVPLSFLEERLSKVYCGVWTGTVPQIGASRNLVPALRSV